MTQYQFTISKMINEYRVYYTVNELVKRLMINEYRLYYTINELVTTTRIRSVSRPFLILFSDRPLF